MSIIPIDINLAKHVEFHPVGFSKCFDFFLGTGLLLKTKTKGRQMVFKMVKPILKQLSLAFSLFKLQIQMFLNCVRSLFTAKTYQCMM